jgi:type VI secretion system secreted protein Hcp
VSQEEATGIARAVERVRRTRRKGLKFALPTVAALGAGTALAVGAIPGNDGTITGCYVTNTDVIQAPVRPGDLRLIDTSQPATLPSGGPNEAGACVNGEATVTWNQHGPQGPAGLPGAQGPQGPQGLPGTAGRNLVGQTSFGFGGGGKTFLKIEGIKGESTVRDHKGEIDVVGFSFGASNPGTGATGGGGGAGKVSISSFTITKKLDKSSPLLFKACATGEHIKKAQISLRKAGKGQQDYLEFKFTDVVISSLQQGTSPKGTPQEQLTLNFKKAEESFLSSKGKVLQSVAITISGNKGA